MSAILDWWRSTSSKVRAQTVGTTILAWLLALATWLQNHPDTVTGLPAWLQGFVFAAVPLILLWLGRRTPETVLTPSVQETAELAGWTRPTS